MNKANKKENKKLWDGLCFKEGNAIKLKMYVNVK